MRLTARFVGFVAALGWANEAVPANTRVVDRTRARAPRPRCIHRPLAALPQDRPQARVTPTRGANFLTSSSARRPGACRELGAVAP